jgi:hypothetical protein
MVTDVILKLCAIKRMEGSSCDIAGGMWQWGWNAGVYGAIKFNMFLFLDNMQSVFRWAFRYSTLFYSLAGEFLTQLSF